MNILLIGVLIFFVAPISLYFSVKLARYAWLAAEKRFHQDNPTKKD